MLVDAEGQLRWASASDQTPRRSRTAGAPGPGAVCGGVQPAAAGRHREHQAGAGLARVHPGPGGRGDLRGLECAVGARPRSGSRLPRAPMLLAKSVGSIGMALPAFLVPGWRTGQQTREQAPTTSLSLADACNDNDRTVLQARSWDRGARPDRLVWTPRQALRGARRPIPSGLTIGLVECVGGTGPVRGILRLCYRACLAMNSRERRGDDSGLSPVRSGVRPPG
jgi:hypothetical protein